MLVGASWRQDLINRLQPEMQNLQVCFVTDFIIWVGIQVWKSSKSKQQIKIRDYCYSLDRNSGEVL